MEHWSGPRQPLPGTRRHRYRCSLPGLTGFTANRRGEADADRRRLSLLAGRDTIGTGHEAGAARSRGLRVIWLSVQPYGVMRMLKSRQQSGDFTVAPKS